MFEPLKNEEEIFQYWNGNKVYDKVRTKNLEGKKFYFLEGPPYASGALAAHHIWVYAIKDAMLRYRRYRGFNLHDRAGFDVHGLPIEHKVEEKLKLTSKLDIENKVGVEKFIGECNEYAVTNVKNAASIAKRFGISLDFDHAYIPSESGYMNKAWSVFKEMYGKDLVYKAEKPLLYCPHCETAISAQGAEIEYRDESDPSIYIGFEVLNDAKYGYKIDIPDGTMLLVWTTTPWTLPANMAVAVNPRSLYILAQIDGADYILAKERLDVVVGETGKNAVVIKEFYGSELEGVRYASPLEEAVPLQSKFRKYHTVLMDEKNVSMAEGTGLVHVAPGHGPEDYELGRRNRIPAFSPVDALARYTADAGRFVGMRVPDEANKAVLDYLKERKSILFLASIRHSYPHCWRCGSKLIYRTSWQWFVNVQKMKSRLIKANDRVAWHPAEAKEWMADTLRSSPDWCISRQRYWGIPIPIWQCDSCGNVEVFGSGTELAKRSGLGPEPRDLHRQHVDSITFKCNKCGGTMKRVEDIFDVWYDSGIAHTASLSSDELTKLFPADVITESKDQLRGWFSTLLKTSVALYNKAPFREVVIGGMLVDEFGDEMHRHLGNMVSALDLLNVSTADGFRLWVSTHPRWQDLRLKKSELGEADRNIITLYNVGNLVREFATLSESDIKNATKPSKASLEHEDAWILSRLNTVIGEVTEAMEGYSLDVAANALKSFLLEDFSRFYLKFAKQRASMAKRSSVRRIASITAYVLKRLLVLFSVFIPFASEYIYMDTFSNGESIFESDWPRAEKKYVNKGLEEEFEMLKDVSAAILGLRERENVKLKQPLLEARIEVEGASRLETIERLSGLIEDYANVKRITVVESKGGADEIKPLFAKIGPEFKSHAGVVAEELAKSDARELMESIEKNGVYTLETSDGMFEIRPEHFTVLRKHSDEDTARFRHGSVSINAELTKEIKEELLARELTRTIQAIRKENGLTKLDRIDVRMAADQQVKASVEKSLANIKGVTRARKITFVGELNKPNQKELEILGSTIKIAVSKVEGRNKTDDKSQ